MVTRHPRHRPADQPTPPADTYGGDVRCTRWRHRRSSWADPAPFDPDAHLVRSVTEAAAKAFVVDHHYSGTYPAARHRYALIDRRHQTGNDLGGTLVGVAITSMPMHPKVLTGPFPDLDPTRDAVELARFVLLDAVPRNAESWFLGRVLRHLATAGIRGVVAFSDPVPRTAADGTTVMPGHQGIIYRASNALYAGRGTARSIVVMPDGTTLTSRALQKVRAGEQGHRYVTDRLEAAGARPVPAGGPDATWLAAALTDIGATRIRHPGNLRYLFTPGSRTDRRHTRIGIPTTRTWPAPDRS